MALPPKFDETLGAMSDATVYRMVTRGTGYTPEAIAAARDEWERRARSPEITAHLETTLLAREHADQAKADAPLSWARKSLFFILGFPLFPLFFLGGLIAYNFGAKGYTRREFDCWSWMWRGFAFTILTSLIASIFGAVFGEDHRLDDADPALLIAAIATSLLIILGLSYRLDQRRAKLKTTSQRPRNA